MAATSVGLGWMEILLVLLGGSGLLGMPPGPRDAAFLKAAPRQSLVYVEWASPAAGQPGARGIDGFIADPEIQALLRAIDKLLFPTDEVGDEDPEQQLPHRDTLRLAKLVTAHAGCLFAVADPPPAGNELVRSPLRPRFFHEFTSASSSMREPMRQRSSKRSVACRMRSFPSNRECTRFPARWG